MCIVTRRGHEARCCVAAQGHDTAMQGVQQGHDMAARACDMDGRRAATCRGMATTQPSAWLCASDLSALRAPYAQPWLAVCAHCALDLFLDSVHCFSHCLDHCS